MHEIQKIIELRIEIGSEKTFDAEFGFTFVSLIAVSVWL